MEVDHISYIFGSFTRRRQSQEVGSAKRRSVVNAAPKISHDRSNLAPQTSERADATSPNRTKSVCEGNHDQDRFKCPKCKRYFIEPRVLPCLHTFCTRCLREMEAVDDDGSWNIDGSDASISIKTDGSSTPQGSGSGGSGYESDKHALLSSEKFLRKAIACPICGTHSSVPHEGILGFPPHYLLQHRMVLATLNSGSTRLLCDFCPTDVPATFRCTECAISLCQICTDTHRRQRNSTHHEVLRLEDARRRGINTVRRQVMCFHHPERELGSFCSTCNQVICHECISGCHKGHTYEPLSRAAKSFTSTMQDALERARSFAKQAGGASTRLQGDAKRVHQRCNQVQEEVEKFVDSYIRSVEEHRRNLSMQIEQAREEKLRAIELEKVETQKRLRDVKEAMVFADELLAEGTNVEVLSFVRPILKKLERCGPFEEPCSLRISESLQFLPEEVAQRQEYFCPLYGIITTQTVCPKNCVLNQEGLQNLRVGRKTLAVLETFDVQNNRLQRGGEHVLADLRHRGAGASRSFLVHVEDRRDGTYHLSFALDVSGKLLLSINVNGQPIQNSPFPVVVRTLRPHHGTFHCCSFCSSGGSKEAACGCGGKLPGGYRGCGHGHEGHPGRRHWSCCGNVLEHSECVRANSTHYQFTL